MAAMGKFEQIQSKSRATISQNRGTIASDAMAGMTFAFVNIPQGMANALLAGVNPVMGLYTLMVATPVAALFTSSVYMNVSTTSALSVAAGDALAGIPAPAKAANMLILVLMIGIVQLIAGLFRLGTLLRFVSNAVMVGFISGVAALIVLGQLGDFTGYHSQFSGKVLQMADLILNFRSVHWPTLLLSLLTLGIIVAVNMTRFAKFSMLIGLLVSTLVAILVQPEGVPLVGDIAAFTGGLLQFQMPNFLYAPNMMASAVAIAIIGLVQGAGVSQSYPNPDGTYPNTSRDFLGQGAANIATGFFQGIPAGGSMSGTALTVSAGARTRLANIFAGLFVMPLVFLFGGLVERIPMPALAALLIVVGFQSFKPHDFQTVWRTGKVPATAMGLTFAATLTLPLQFAVFVGVAVSLLMHVFRSSNQIRLVQWKPVPGGFPLERPAPEQLASNDITILNAYGSLFFAAASTAEARLPEIGDARRPVVIFAMRGRDEVGSTFLSVIDRYAKALRDHDGKLVLVGVGPNVMLQLERTGMFTRLGRENILPEEEQLGTAMNQAIEEAYAFLAIETKNSDQE
jgi:SulP family sulfate permease